MRAIDIIRKKRDGEALTEKEIDFFIQGFTRGDIPDYQAAAWLMAVYFRGLDKPETIALTRSMMRSGDVLDLRAIQGIKVDKHSTGGVGDKTSLVVGPLVAAAGVPVAKMSGRGLGHTGGTIDKLESFPGFRVELEDDEFFRQVNTIGIAICAQTANLAPADKKLYALRDVTATIENTGLIAGSIMSKKLAAGADAIVLDVKWGHGAFMKTLADARNLAKLLVEIGEGMGKRTIAVISDMNQPLGYAVGNIVEVKEAIATLKNDAPPDLLELSLTLGSHMLLLAGKAPDIDAGREILQEQLHSGRALEKLKLMVEAQGGDPDYVENPGRFPAASFQQVFSAQQTGYIHEIIADRIGLASMLSGAGRETKESPIDLTAGVVLHHKKGAYVETGSPLATLYSNDEQKLREALGMLRTAFVIKQNPPADAPVVSGVVTIEEEQLFVKS